MTARRLSAPVLVAMLIAVLTGTAGAADPSDPRAAREETRREQAALAADLDVLEASETELDAAADALAADVRSQKADVESSQQAVEAATAESDRARAALKTAKDEIDVLTAQLIDRAVDSFISPVQSSLYDVAVSADFTEAARKQAFISQLVADEAALVDELDDAREDMEVQQAAAEVAESSAEQRRVETAGRLAGLQVAAGEQARVQAAIEERQAEVVSEIDSLAAAEAELTAVIEQAEREQREREERARAEAAAAERERAVAEQRARDQAARDQAARSRVANPPARPSPRRAEAPPAPVASPSSGDQTSDDGCIWPTRGTVTSEYGSRWGRLHAGIDISAPIGTPIYAAKAGTVLVAGTQSGYGTTVVLGHGDMTTLYGHQSRLAVSAGASVGQGDVIGYVGNTGRSTGPHVHFETRYGGTPRNPRTCLP